MILSSTRAPYRLGRRLGLTTAARHLYLFVYGIVQVCTEVNAPQDCCARSGNPQPLSARKEEAPAHERPGLLAQSIPSQLYYDGRKRSAASEASAITDRSSAAWRLKRCAQQAKTRRTTQTGSKWSLDSHVRCSDWLAAALVNRTLNWGQAAP